MNYVTLGMEPKLPLQYFEEIAAIPHGSNNEKELAIYIEEKAKSFGWPVRRDEYNNVLVKRPATRGFESAEPVLMQAHIDMVCEKTADTVHDFQKDGLQLYIDGDFLKAKGTTLGADDGYGVALMLALMDEDGDSFVHPELQFLFTAGEEIGFVGAMKMDCSDVTARKMIGLDAGPEGITSITSAGSQEHRAYIDPEFSECEEKALCISIRGLRGGHSAVNITDEKANANKIIGRLLYRISKVTEFRVSSVSCGTMYNAIAREGSFSVIVPEEKQAAVKETIENVYREIKEEYAFTDPDIVLEMKEENVTRVMSANATKALTRILFATPNGVHMMNKQVEYLPVISVNVGICRMVESGEIMISSLVRSSSVTLLEKFISEIALISEMAGESRFEMGERLPGWPYQKESKMRDLYKEIYRRRTGREVKEFGVHGGLELGVFSEKLPGLDVVPIGPDSYDCHTVTERLNIPSYARTYELIKEVLSACAE